MVRTLLDIVRRAESLPEAEQEAIAAIIKAEIEDEEAWQQRFASTSTTLEKLVSPAKKSEYNRKKHVYFIVYNRMVRPPQLE